MGVDTRGYRSSTCALCHWSDDFKFRIWDFFTGGIFTMRRNTSFNVPQIPCSACLRPVPQRYSMAWVKESRWDTLAYTCTRPQCQSYYRSRGYRDHMSLPREATWGENWIPRGNNCEVCRIAAPQDLMHYGGELMVAYAVVEEFWINRGDNVISLCDVCQKIFYPEALRLTGTSQRFVRSLPELNSLTCSARNEMGLF